MLSILNFRCCLPAQVMVKSYIKIKNLTFIHFTFYTFCRLHDRIIIANFYHSSDLLTCKRLVIFFRSKNEKNLALFKIPWRQEKALFYMTSSNTQMIVSFGAFNRHSFVINFKRDMTILRFWCPKTCKPSELILSGKSMRPSCQRISYNLKINCE